MPVVRKSRRRGMGQRAERNASWREASSPSAFRLTGGDANLDEEAIGSSMETSAMLEAMEEIRTR